MMLRLVLGIFVSVCRASPNGVAILLPLTFNGLTSAIVMLSPSIGVRCSAAPSASIPFNIPGEAWRVAATWNYPMAQQGRATAR
jgi:TctA family transporter